MIKIGTLFFIGLIIIFVLLLDWYTFSAIKLLSANLQSRWIRQSIYISFWTVCITIPVVLIFGVFHIQADHSMNLLTTYAFNALITLMLTEMVVVIFLFSEDLIRWIYALISWISSLFNSNTQDASGFMPSRRKFVSQLALLVAAIPFASIIYGITKGKHNYKVHHHTLKLDNLPDAFDGFRIVQLSDIHVGSFKDRSQVEEGIKLVNEQKADLFVFTGDFVNNVASELKPWMDVFSKIKTPHGQFSILGNHDYADYVQWESVEAKNENLKSLIRYQTEMGYKVLLDEHVDIVKDGQKISLIGIQNWGKGFGEYGDFEKALKGIDPNTIKILLSHDPSHFDHQVKTHPTHIHLTLSGHTHGMQFGFEFKNFRWSPSKWKYPKWAGLYHENKRFINVNRGFGYIGFSGRVGIWPEVSIIELRKA